MKRQKIEQLRAVEADFERAERALANEYAAEGREMRLAKFRNEVIASRDPDFPTTTIREDLRHADRDRTVELLRERELNQTRIEFGDIKIRELWAKLQAARVRWLEAKAARSAAEIAEVEDEIRPHRERFERATNEAQARLEQLQAEKAETAAALASTRRLV